MLFAGALSTAWIAPLFDPDEGYYPATAAESVDAGSAWDPRFNGEPRWDKPILTYALIEAAFAVLGRTVVAARLPSIIEAALLVLIVGFSVAFLAGPSRGSLAAWVLCTTLGVQIFARVAHPEIAVVLMITVAELLTVLWITTPAAHVRFRLACAGGAAVGLGVLAKGPVAIVLPVLALVTGSALVFGIRPPSRQAVRHLALSAVVAAVVCVPWYAAMTVRHGVPFLEEAVWRHNVERFTGQAFGHRSGPWFFLFPALLAMFPWSAFVPSALVAAFRRPQEPAAVLRVFMAAAAVTSVLINSASGSKLAHYALAFVPPLSILVALRMHDFLARNQRTASFVWTPAVVGFAAIALLVAPVLVGRVVGAREILSGLSGSATGAQWMLARALWPPALLLAITAAVVAAARQPTGLRMLMVAGAAMPLMLLVDARSLLDQAYPWKHFGQLVRDSALPVWFVGPRAPSLTFYAGRPLVRITESDGATWNPPADDGWIVADTEWFSRRLDRDGAAAWQVLANAGGRTLARWQGAHRDTQPLTRDK